MMLEPVATVRTRTLSSGRLTPVVKPLHISSQFFCDEFEQTVSAVAVCALSIEKSGRNSAADDCYRSDTEAHRILSVQSRFQTVSGSLSRAVESGWAHRAVTVTDRCRYRPATPLLPRETCRRD